MLDLVNIERVNRETLGWNDRCDNCSHPATGHRFFRNTLENCTLLGCDCEEYVDSRKILCKGCGSRVMVVAAWKNTQTILHEESCRAQKACQQKTSDGRYCGRPFTGTIEHDQHSKETIMVSCCGMHLRMEQEARERAVPQQNHLDQWRDRSYLEQAADLTLRLGVPVRPHRSGYTSQVSEFVLIRSDDLKALCDLYDIKDNALDQSAAKEGDEEDAEK